MGTAVTAEDVIYSFETCAETTVDTALAAALSSVEDISAEGSTVTITLSEANRGLPELCGHGVHCPGGV